MAALNSFNQWDQQRQRGGEAAEARFADIKGLNVPTLRTTSDAKQQIRTLLTNAGFPEDSFAPIGMNFFGNDANVDLVVALLAMGHYPNVCMHKEKRKAS